MECDVGGTVRPSTRCEAVLAEHSVYTHPAKNLYLGDESSDDKLS